MTVSKRKFIIGLVVFFLLSCSREIGGFDELCKIFTEIENANPAMSADEEITYYTENFKKRIHSIDPIEVMSAVIQADPAVRYSLIKQSAEYSLKRQWDCVSMKSLMGRYGEIKKP